MIFHLVKVGDKFYWPLDNKKGVCVEASFDSADIYILWKGNLNSWHYSGVGFYKLLQDGCIKQLTNESNKVCECGAAKCGSPGHSHWCPLA